MDINILGFGSGAAGAAPYNVQFLVLAGGGSGGTCISGGGGGAGGYRIIASKAHEVIPCTAYPITVGGAGAPVGAIPQPSDPGTQEVQVELQFLTLSLVPAEVAVAVTFDQLTSWK